MTPTDTEKARESFFDDCEETPFMKACAERDRWRLRCMDADGKLAEQNALLKDHEDDWKRIQDAERERDDLRNENAKLREALEKIASRSSDAGYNLTMMAKEALGVGR